MGRLSQTLFADFYGLFVQKIHICVGGARTSFLLAEDTHSGPNKPLRTYREMQNSKSEVRSDIDTCQPVRSLGWCLIGAG